MAEHGKEGHHSGAAGEQLHRTVGAGGPDEVTADRAAELEKVARAQDVGEYGETSPSSRRSTTSSIPGRSGAEAME
jgi:hypothetical protein